MIVYLLVDIPELCMFRGNLGFWVLDCSRVALAVVFLHSDLPKEADVAHSGKKLFDFGPLFILTFHL